MCCDAPALSVSALELHGVGNLSLLFDRMRTIIFA